LQISKAILKKARETVTAMLTFYFTQQRPLSRHVPLNSNEQQGSRRNTICLFFRAVFSYFSF